MISEGSCDTEDWSNDAEMMLKLPENNIYLEKKVHLHQSTVDPRSPSQSHGIDIYMAAL